MPQKHSNFKAGAGGPCDDSATLQQAPHQRVCITGVRVCALQDSMKLSLSRTPCAAFLVWTVYSFCALAYDALMVSTLCSELSPTPCLPTCSLSLLLWHIHRLLQRAARSMYCAVSEPASALHTQMLLTHTQMVARSDHHKQGKHDTSFMLLYSLHAVSRLARAKHEPKRLVAWPAQGIRMRIMR
jgi:hypothetical protein